MMYVLNSVRNVVVDDAIDGKYCHKYINDPENAVLILKYIPIPTYHMNKQLIGQKLSSNTRRDPKMNSGGWVNLRNVVVDDAIYGKDCHKYTNDPENAVLVLKYIPIPTYHMSKR